MLQQKDYEELIPLQLEKGQAVPDLMADGPYLLASTAEGGLATFSRVQVDAWLLRGDKELFAHHTPWDLALICNPAVAISNRKEMRLTLENKPPEVVVAEMPQEVPRPCGILLRGAWADDPANNPFAHSITSVDHLRSLFSDELKYDDLKPRKSHVYTDGYQIHEYEMHKMAGDERVEDSITFIDGNVVSRMVLADRVPRKVLDVRVSIDDLTREFDVTEFFVYLDHPGLYLATRGDTHVYFPYRYAFGTVLRFGTEAIDTQLRQLLAQKLQLSLEYIR